jgi:hypothetical protein
MHCIFCFWGARRPSYQNVCVCMCVCVCVCVCVVVGNDCFGQSHIILTALGVGFVVLDRSGFGCVYVAHSNKCHVHIPSRSL